ncbi:hypothetical protein AGMMS49938_12150 [Fibrobacterales bacterium]|nr:hypothetical protein AGMMS49938_12150 [Fibrobacterales bacterium]
MSIFDEKNNIDWDAVFNVVNNAIELGEPAPENNSRPSTIEGPIAAAQKSFGFFVKQGK